MMFFLIMAWHKHAIIESMFIADVILVHFLLMIGAYIFGLRLAEKVFPIK